MMTRLTPLCILFLLGCNESSEKVAAPEPVTMTYPQFDQMSASARANPILDKRLYAVTLRNHGGEKIVALVTEREQWRSNESIDPAWHEQILPSDEAGVIEVSPGEEHTFEIGPRTFDNVLLRFGITLIGQDGETFPKLVVWSNPVTPHNERWTNKAGQNKTR
jgi:hypothetical protein